MKRVLTSSAIVGVTLRTGAVYSKSVSSSAPLSLNGGADGGLGGGSERNSSFKIAALEPPTATARALAASCTFAMVSSSSFSKASATVCASERSFASASACRGRTSIDRIALALVESIIRRTGTATPPQCPLPVSSPQCSLPVSALPSAAAPAAGRASVSAPQCPLPVSAPAARPSAGRERPAEPPPATVGEAGVGSSSSSRRRVGGGLGGGLGGGRGGGGSARSNEVATTATLSMPKPHSPAIALSSRVAIAGSAARSARESASVSSRVSFPMYIGGGNGDGGGGGA
mmetsp:Transcript_7961/g.20496  ORF Transcript_7961/g.20496 Transcript_7961/m.20496 type:complete len:288 (+) Transcript_7961:441-1304(+)